MYKSKFKTNKMSMLYSQTFELNDIALISRLFWQQYTKIIINNSDLRIEQVARQGCDLGPYVQYLFRYNISEY